LSSAGITDAIIQQIEDFRCPRGALFAERRTLPGRACPSHASAQPAVPKLVWRVKLVAELQAGVTTEEEVARLERDEQAGLAELRLAEAKQLTATLQATAAAA